MPFTDRKFRAFSEAGVLSVPPKQSGVYVIFSGVLYIFVDYAEDVRAAMLLHLHLGSVEADRIHRYHPTQWAYQPLPKDKLIGRANELIAELMPVVNVLGSTDPTGPVPGGHGCKKEWRALQRATRELEESRKELAEMPGFAGVEIGQELPHLTKVSRRALRRVSAAMADFAARQDAWYACNHAAGLSSSPAAQSQSHEPVDDAANLDLPGSSEEKD